MTVASCSLAVVAEVTSVELNRCLGCHFLFLQLTNSTLCRVECRANLISAVLRMFWPKSVNTQMSYNSTIVDFRFPVEEVVCFYWD